MIKKYIYSSLTVFAILIIIGIFIILALFITTLIDTALISEQKSQTKEAQLKEQVFETAKNKLSIESGFQITTTTEMPSSTTPIIPEEKKIENKTLLSLAILNSTGISGRAGNLAQLITANGFKISYTGNAKKREPKTIIQIKETSKKIFPKSFKEIIKLVENQYSITESTLDSNSEYDAIIIIGMN